MNNESKIKNLLDRLVNVRQTELNETLKDHQHELDSIPEILQFRIRALQEVNPEEFNGENADPCLKLSSLATNYLVSHMSPDADEIDPKDYEAAHARYGIILDEDVNPYLVYELTFAYLKDLKDGIIDKKGNIIGDINKSQVMHTSHNGQRHGNPLDAFFVIEEAEMIAESRNAKEDKTSMAGMHSRIINKGGYFI